MLSFTILNVFVFIFLLVAIVEQSLLPDLSHARTISKSKLSPLCLIIFTLTAFFLTLILVLNVPSLFLKWYLSIVFSVLILGHVHVMTEQSTKTIRVIALSAALTIIVLKFVNASQIIHILFILAAITWVGPLFDKIGILTVKRLIVLSIAWFLYDIAFVWLTHTAASVNDKAASLGFSLAIVWGRSLIGTGDLLWANLLVGVMKTRKMKVIAAIVLVGSNVLYGWFDYVRGIDMFFPLLVLWVPIGIGVLLTEKYFTRSS